MNQSKLLISILTYINNNLYSKISLNDLSRSTYYNKDYIMRIFKKKFNMTIIEYINKKRIYNSLITLKETNNSILRVAIKYGFTSQEYYCEMFNRIIGVSPTTYRNFTKVNNNVSYKDINKIRKNIVDLNYILKSIEKYEKSTSTEPPKVLSIFK